MGHNYDEVDVKCPFYRASTKTSISCEGLDEHCGITLQFYGKNGRPMPDERNAKKKHYCDCCYQDCIVYKMLLTKYE